MLLNNFFYIDTLTQKEHELIASIHINVEHAILKGHFQNQPIVPGVCMLEMLKEILQQNLNIKLQLQSAPVVKFLTMFAPPTFTHAIYTIQLLQNEINQFQITATLQYEQSIFMKFKGVFVTQS
jgi:3-hydroxyacyl-[acyl-carrier-protein] dehydratase